MPTDAPTWDETTPVTPTWDETTEVAAGLHPTADVNGPGGFNYGGKSTKIAPDTALGEDFASDLLEHASRPGVKLPKFEVHPEDSITAAVTKTAVNLVTSVPEFATSPLGVATGGAAGVIPRTVAAAFLADSSKNVVQGAKEAGKNWDQMTPAEKAATATELGGQAVLAAAMAHGATRHTPGKAEVLAKALDQTTPEIPAWEDSKPIIEKVSAPAWEETTPIQTTEQPPEPKAEATEDTESTEAKTDLIPVDVSDHAVNQMKGSVRTERPPDILDTIAEYFPNGVKFDAADHADAIEQAQNLKGGTAKTLMSATEGEPADKVLDGLHLEGLHQGIENVDELAQAMVAADQARLGTHENVNAAARQLAEESARTQLFEAANVPRPNAETLPVEQLFIGDRFTLNGQPVTVKDIPLDAETGQPYGVDLEGAYGPQHVPAGQAVHLDAGSLKDVNAVDQTPGRVAASGTSASKYTKENIRNPLTLFRVMSGEAEVQGIAGGLAADRGDVTVFHTTARSGSDYVKLVENNTGETVTIRFSDHFAPHGGGYRVTDMGGGREAPPDFNVVKNKIYSLENGKWEHINIEKFRWHLENWLPQKANGSPEAAAAGIKTPSETPSQRAEAQADKGNVSAWQKEEASALTKPTSPQGSELVKARIAAAGSSAPRQRVQGGPIQVPAAVAATPAPKVGPIRTALRNVSTGFKSIFAPHTLDAGAATVANILRDVNGEKANNLARADEAMHPWRSEFAKTPVAKDWSYDPTQPLPHNYAIIDALEHGGIGLPARYLTLKAIFDQAFADRIKVIQQYAPNALQHLIANYFPHLWEDPQRAAGVMAQASTKLFAGRKEFLKQRSLAMFRDGLERGLKPISDNPVDLLLAKMHSMDKFIAALKAQAEFKAIGKMKFKYALEKLPDGWRVIDDPAFIVHAPPTVTLREAFDAQLRTKTLELLQKLGVPEKRLASLGGKRWGMAYERPEQIKTRFGGPMSVYWHELGHVLDWRYKLQDSFLKQGKQFDNELRALADRRLPANQPRTKAVYNKALGKVQQRPTSFASYVRRAEEKMAVMAESYVHAPEVFKKVAPTVYAAFDKFIEDHPELHDIRDIKPSIRIDTAEIEQKLPGTLKLGDWIMPEGPAQVIQNYLSPGLASSGVYRSLRSASNLLNAAQLGLSGFHVGFTSLDAVVNAAEVGMYRALHGDLAGAGRTLAKAPIAPIHNYYVGKAVQRAMLDPNATHIRALGMKVPISKAAHDYAALAVKGGLRATVDPFWQTHFTKNFMRAIYEAKQAWQMEGIPGVAKSAVQNWNAPLNLAFAAIEQAMRPIAEYLVPRQKLGVFALLAKSEMDRLGPNAGVHDVRAAMARAANSTEDRMGQMTYDNLFYNRTAKDLALLAFRAYGWQLGKYRHLIGAGADTVAGVKSVAQGKLPEITHRQLYFVALTSIVAGLGGVLHYVLSGRPPQDLRDYLHPSTGQVDANGNDKRLSLPSYLKDLESDENAISRGWKEGGPLGVGKGVWTATYHRANPWASEIVDVLNNRDFYGTQIWNPNDPLEKKMLDQARHIAQIGIPFSIAGARKLSEGEHSTRDLILPFIGIVPAKQAISMTPAQIKAAEIAQAQSSVGGRTQAQAQHSQALRDAVASIRGGKPLPDGSQISKQDEATIRQRLGLTPLQFQVQRMTMDNAMAVYDLANPPERQQLQPIIVKKLQGQAKRGEAVNPDYIKVVTAPVK